MKEHRENLAAGQAFLTILLLAGTILVGLVFTAAMYVGAGVLVAGLALAIYFLARHGRTVEAGPQPILLRVEEPHQSNYRKAA